MAITRRALFVAPLLLIPAVRAQEAQARGVSVCDATEDHVYEYVTRALEAWGLPWKHTHADAHKQMHAGDVKVVTQSLASALGETQKIEAKDGGWAYRVTIDTAMPKQWLYSTILHELGHAIGLGHSREPDSVMSESAMPLAPSVNDLARAKRALKHRKGKR